MHGFQPGLVACAYNGSPGMWRQEDHKFKVIVSYIMGLRLAWDAWDSLSKSKILKDSPFKAE